MTEVAVGRFAVIHEDDSIVPGLKARMTIPNPVYEQAVNLGNSTRGIPEFLFLYEKVGRYYRFPRAVVNPYVSGATVTVKDETTRGELITPFSSKIALRDTQIPFVDELEKRLELGYGAVGQAEAGFGKTVCSLDLAARKGVKTIILVHKEFLMTQWIERMLGTKLAAQKLGLSTGQFSSIEEAMLDLTIDDVGIVQQDRCEYEGKKIVVAMAQSLLAREYPPGFYESFGLVIVDEVHRFAAPTFQKTIIQFPARYRLGVTATPERNDKLEDIFFSHIGRIAAVGEGRKEKPRINFVRTPVNITDQVRQKFLTRGRENLVKVTSFLVEHEARNRHIIRVLMEALAKDRKVLVLSDRIKHLEVLRELFIAECRKEQLGISSAYYIGGLSLDERKQAEKMQVLFATNAMAKEGLDIPTLDTLLMVTPKGDVHQAVGRIMRSHPDKKEPVVVDFVDTQIGICKRLAGRREQDYRHSGWL